MNFQNIELFSNLEKNDIKELKSITKVLKAIKNEIIFYEGEPSTYLHLLSQGKAKIYKTDAKGNEIVLHHFTAPSLLAERANLSQIRFPANCKMESDGVVLKISFEKFKELMQNEDICFKIMQSLLKKMNSLEETINNNMVLDIPTRIAKFIYENTEKFQTLKQHEIASILNIKPETLSRKLKKLKELGIIENKHSKLIVKDKERLKEFYSWN
jgi:CRP/FNR family transcriptional regulator